MVDGTLIGSLLALLTTLPLAWKWCLGVRRTATVVAVLALLATLLVVRARHVIALDAVLQAGLVWLLTVAVAAAALAYRFYRDPERVAPARDDAIVSPADGRVIYVRRSHGGALPVSTKHGRDYPLRELTRTPLRSEDAVVIGIAMSFLDVHVNRAPIGGQIALRRHFPGRFGSLRRPEMVFENERTTTIIERGELQVAVVQIASRLVRQIASFVREGQQVALGQRIGVIRLGSQVDLVLPARPDVRLAVEAGDRVAAGESIVAVLERPAEPAPVPPPSVTRVITVDAQLDPRWEAFVAAHPEGLVYHHPAWLQVLEQAHGHKPLGLACEAADGHLRGVLPLFRSRGLLAGRRLSSLPHTPVAGPLGLDEAAAATLVRAAVERVREEPGVRLLLKSPGAHLDGLVDGMVGVPWEATYVLNLPRQPEALRFGNSRNHARIKWAVNKAAKAGVEVRPAETEGELRAWYALYLETMRWHAVPPRPYRFFRIAWDLLRPRGLLRLLVAEQRQAARPRLLAGSIFLMFGQTVFYAFNGRRREALALRPNDLIQWQAIHEACRAGFRRYDFGEVQERNEGLAEFKSKWGAEPRRPYRYYYPTSREMEAGALAPDRGVRRLAAAAWRRLPLRVTVLVGDWLYGHL